MVCNLFLNKKLGLGLYYRLRESVRLIFKNYVITAITSLLGVPRDIHATKTPAWTRVTVSPPFPLAWTPRDIHAAKNACVGCTLVLQSSTTGIYVRFNRARLAITAERYVCIVEPLRYPQIGTHRRVLLAVSAICITASCLLIVQYIHRRSYGIGLRSFCDIAANITHFTNTFVGFLPLTFVFLLNFHILCVARKQRKRILAETTITTSVDNSLKESLNSVMNYSTL